MEIGIAHPYGCYSPPGPGPKLLDRMNFNYHQDYLRDVSGPLVPIQISRKEEIRIFGCEHKKIFLENIKSVIKMRVQVQKILEPTGSNDWYQYTLNRRDYFYNFNKNFWTVSSLVSK